MFALLFFLLLIADDVGLGKTIEAGLVAQELILRQRVQRVLVVCPSSLQIQ
jgi:SNF2 family DNA or RNA helicase